MPCPDPNEDVPSFFTYFGQFVDHDMTLDKLLLTELLAEGRVVEPSTIINNRDPRLNLDSVYGLGPEANPELYELDKLHLRVNGRDLPRDPLCVISTQPATSAAAPDCKAILFEGRNDENQIIAQIHVAFLRAHNKLIDQGYNLQHARELMRWRYQWIVVHEFLPEVLDPDVYAAVFHDSAITTKYFDPKQAFKAAMPVEFSVAAYRFGHSQVRRAYILLDGCRTNSPAPAECGVGKNPKVQVFNGTAGDLHGGRQIALDHTIFWPNFLRIVGQETGQPNTGQVTANISRKIDTLLSSGLFTLPAGAEPDAGTGEGTISILAQRNLQRANIYGLPSGQDVAARLGIKVIPNTCPVETDIPNTCPKSIASEIPRLAAALADPSYQGKAPLWLYILAESTVFHNGHKLGPTGSRIVAEVIGGLLAGDVRSYYRRGWTPPGGSYRAQDLLVDAGVLTLQ